MEIPGKANTIKLTDFTSPQMRAFHLTWMSFFLCFFGWFGIAPLMPIVREDLGLTKVQIGNTIIASVAITILVRLLIGPLCDRYGPRRVYAALLTLGALPVIGIGLSDSNATFLVFRLAIGAIGASFVVTQYHTSQMFAPNVVGAANATTAGWGNLGGGVTQMVMPLIFAFFVAIGFIDSSAWRAAMVVPGAAMLLFAWLYYRWTVDTPRGDLHELRARNIIPPVSNGYSMKSFRDGASDRRVWMLFLVYGACFGVELTINNIAAMYYYDRFQLDLKTAGLIAGLFGLMNIFARSLGGILSDRIAAARGLQSRVTFLFAVLLAEGLALMLFSQMSVLPLAIATMVLFSLFVQMAEGATYGVVPFINRKSLGTVAGIVGAGGNAGAVAAGFLFRSESLTTQQGLLIMGCAVSASAFAALAVRFSAASQAEENERYAAALAERAIA